MVALSLLVCVLQCWTRIWWCGWVVFSEVLHIFWSLRLSISYFRSPASPMTSAAFVEPVWVSDPQSADPVHHSRQDNTWDHRPVPEVQSNPWFQSTVVVLVPKWFSTIVSDQFLAFWLCGNTSTSLHWVNLHFLNLHCVWGTRIVTIWIGWVMRICLWSFTFTSCFHADWWIPYWCLNV